ncbi:polyprenyl synthetase family protein [Ancylomarina euxinus]|uniref:Polyprenyl synthetase family protein n=1 Tax=Ancylomarina euxinus TaxID=2283627 RepID=A0A425Y7L4_9BACT|nr:polyprenyl synthetase family protein [Ancylomarina euxinus]MCZ4693621.1 polyprenyl synthetase family protein [Ancylomarina euxinus]MUP13849.1 polyprenyl synthetase family protein [Ancylomarina euxinus]RRG24519.1 polyprenyl synthetase family protein [Ancylomarina euxinus]
MTKASTLNTIKAPIKKELKEFDPYFRDAMRTKVRLLDIINQYIIKRKGKEMRPILVFLAAKLCGEINQSTYIAATLTQLLHTATLVHDDVVDEAYERRGFFSINALWKSKVAVLVGDFLLSKGLLIALDNNEFDQLKFVSESVKDMSEGELLQIEKSKKLNITEDLYFDIIYKKTASLIAACTQLGALSVNADVESQEKMKQFGVYLGIAFQIKDDLFDYDKQAAIGKPTGNDIKERKLTLPLIYVLRNCSPDDRKWVLKSLKKHNKDKARVQELIKFVKDKGGIEYTREKMLEYKAKADAILMTFANSEVKDAMIALVNYTIERKK